MYLIINPSPLSISLVISINYTALVDKAVAVQAQHEKDLGIPYLKELFLAYFTDPNINIYDLMVCFIQRIG